MMTSMLQIMTSMLQISPTVYPPQGLLMLQQVKDLGSRLSFEGVFLVSWRKFVADFAGLFAS